MSIEPEADVREQIETSLRSGRKIEAIKLLRSATGSSLKEAKEAVERIASTMSSEMGSTSGSSGGDDPRSSVQKSSGCGAVMLLGLGASILGLWLGL